MKGWHVAALFAAVFFLKGAVTASGGWFLTSSPSCDAKR